MARTGLDAARDVLRRYYGYPDFRPAQLPAVEAVLSGRDAVIVLATGGGKSIVFQVPALCLPRLTVVVSPLISLMADQVQALERRGIGATFLNSTLTPDETAARIHRLRRGEVKLLYAAPERLMMPATSRLLREVGVDMLAIDEAHCVSEWGQVFRPGFLRLAAVRKDIGNPQTVALTATATPRVRRDVARLLELEDPVSVVGGFDRPNLTFRVERVADEAKRILSMIRHLKAFDDPAVVYASTRRQVEQVARLLSSGRVNAVPYHAGLPADRRARTQDAFMNGSARVIVATNAFGMGIDKPDVRLVLHYMHSGSLEDYYQEAGRAGRDGAPSRCVLLFHPTDRQVHDRMREHGQVSLDLVRSVWRRLSDASRGRRRVPLDSATLAVDLGGSSTEDVASAIRILVERGVIDRVEEPARVRVRLLATPLRIECERSSLSATALEILELLDKNASQEWQHVDVAADRGSGGSQVMRRAVAELEERQLIFADHDASQAVVRSDGMARQFLERMLLQVRTRREVERAKLSSMVGYASSHTCRRRYVLEYFGDRGTMGASCAGCDVCSP
jgi:ATP-dependent DNA helicase RecQ